MSSVWSRRFVCSGLLASSIALIGIACSSSEDADVKADGGVPGAPSGSDGGDAVADDADAIVSDAGEDAGPPTCSADAVCHTELPADAYLRDVWSAGDGIVWAVGWIQPFNDFPVGTVFRWDGTSWAVQFKLEKETRLNAIWGSIPTDLWMGSDQGLFHGTGASSASITWTKVREEPITSIWGLNGNDVWAVGSTVGYPPIYDGKVLHYTGPGADGGDGWQSDPVTSHPAAYRKVWGTSANDVWLGAIVPGQFTSRGFAFRRRPDGDGGFTWSEPSTPAFGAELSGAGSFGPTSVWLLGDQPTGYDGVFRGTPKMDATGDVEWSTESFGTCPDLQSAACVGLTLGRAVWGTSPSDVYLASDSGQLRHWDGSSYMLIKTTLTKIPDTLPLYAMWGKSGVDLWIVGDRIALHKVPPLQPKGAFQQP